MSALTPSGSRGQPWDSRGLGWEAGPKECLPLPSWAGFEICFPKGPFLCRNPHGKGSEASVDPLKWSVRLCVHVYKAALF